jgi:hypothetical protein
MLVSGTTPRHIFLSNPDGCHPITCLGFLRSLYLWRREDEGLDAIMADGGWSLERDGRLTDEERRWGSSSARKQE